ncbi:MAG: glycine zipper 2TM domain-containing protein [Burkholderiales bacterium]|nr:glycine zipper 2TM domain-containing protein [Burkholderiales bacterium]
MIRKTHAAVAAVALLFGVPALAQSITLYEGEGFRGRAVTTDAPVRNVERLGMRDADSVIVDRGRWEVCELPRFEGRCALLRRGHYDSAQLGFDVQSARPANSRRRYDLEPQVSAAPLYEYRQRPAERVYTVPVSWSRAVVGQASQRCWIERQSVPVASSGQANVGGALAGAVIGGVLGHQIGGGSGRDAATAAGVVAGAAIGANQGGGSTVYGTQDVQRCTTANVGPPSYYEVAYNFRGVEHRVQMSQAPGATVTVNERGEPRM